MLGYDLLLGGTRYLRDSTARVDAQRDAMRVLLSLSREMRESSYASVVCLDEAPGASCAGTVFASVRKVNGQLSLDSQGAPLWPNLVCYARVGLDLFRWTEDLATPSATPPNPNTLGKGVVYFSNQNPRRRFSNGVSALRVSKLTNPNRIHVLLKTSQLNGEVEQQVQTEIVSGP